MLALPIRFDKRRVSYRFCSPRANAILDKEPLLTQLSELTEQLFPYFGRPFRLRTQDDKAAWFMTELARVEPPRNPIEVKLLQFVHCKFIYQMKGAMRQMPSAIHVAFSMSPQLNSRPERVILSTSLDLLAVFGSSIPGKPPVKTAKQFQNYKEITDYFPAFHIPVGPEASLGTSRAKFGHCCEDKPWKALAGYDIVGSIVKRDTS